jgi:hypothetical protein
MLPTNRCGATWVLDHDPTQQRIFPLRISLNRLGHHGVDNLVRHFRDCLGRGGNGFHGSLLNDASLPSIGSRRARCPLVLARPRSLRRKCIDLLIGSRARMEKATQRRRERIRRPNRGLEPAYRTVAAFDAARYPSEETCPDQAKRDTFRNSVVAQARAIMMLLGTAEDNYSCRPNHLIVLRRLQQPTTISIARWPRPGSGSLCHPWW